MNDINREGRHGRRDTADRRVQHRRRGDHWVMRLNNSALAWTVITVNVVLLSLVFWACGGLHIL